MQFRGIFFSILIMALSSSAFTDTIVLKNGKKLNGKVIQYDQDPFYLKMSAGKMSFSHKEVKEVLFDQTTFESNKFAQTGTRTSSTVVAEPFTQEEILRFQRLMDSLEYVNNEEEESGYNEERQKIVASLARMGKNAGPYLVDELEKGNPQNVQYVLRALVGASRNLGLQKAVQLSENARSGEVRITALALLGEANVRRYADVIERGLNDPQGLVRAEALRQLGTIPGVDKAQKMVSFLEDKSSAVRIAAWNSLNQITGESFETAPKWNDWFNSQNTNAKSDGTAENTPATETDA